MYRYAIVLLAVGLGLLACKRAAPPKVGDAHLALAMGVEDVPAAAESAPVVEVMPGQPVTIPDAPQVRLAIDRNATWGEVKAVLDLMAQRQQEPVLLVTERHKVKTFQLEDSFEGPALDVIAYTDGQACVRHPDISEGKCVRTRSGKYIDAAFTREIVREAVRGYGMHQVEVRLPRALSWADTVRVVDGARTCCLGDPVKVKLRPPETAETAEGVEIMETAENDQPEPPAAPAENHQPDQANDQADQP